MQYTALSYLYSIVKVRFTVIFRNPRLRPRTVITHRNPEIAEGLLIYTTSARMSRENLALRTGRFAALALGVGTERRIASSPRRGRGQVRGTPVVAHTRNVPLL